MDTVRWQFDAALQREGKTVVDHSGLEHTVLFRRNSDKNQIAEYVTIFHTADSGIVPGYTLERNNRYFLVLNAESPENAVYRRSDAVLCNQKVDLAYLEETIDEKFDTVTVAVKYAEDVPVFVMSGLDASYANITANDFKLLLPARYGLSLENVITLNGLKQSKSTNDFSVNTLFFKPESIDYKNMNVDAQGNISGLLMTLGQIYSNIQSI